MKSPLIKALLLTLGLLVLAAAPALLLLPDRSKALSDATLPATMLAAR